MEGCHGANGSDGIAKYTYSILNTILIADSYHSFGPKHASSKDDSFGVLVAGAKLG